MSGRYRFRRRSGFRRSFRSSFRNNRSSIVRRARGNARAANAQADTTDVTINLMTKIKSGVTAWKQNNEIKMGGVIPVNIFELLRKSDFFNSYAPMYDQFRVTSIKVKVTPVSWKTYNQFNLPNQIGEYNITEGTQEQPFAGQTSTFASAEPIEPGDLLQPNPAGGANRITVIDDKHYLYPQALTVVTAWDRTGLDKTQIEDYYDDVDGRMVCTIGDNITTYSSAKSTQLVAGANFNCTRYLYPSSQQEKSLYFSTSDLKLQQNYSWTVANNPYVIDQVNAGAGDHVIYEDSYITNLMSSPNCPFKPTFLLGVLSIDPLIPDQAHRNNLNVEEAFMENKINPVTFNLEFDIGVTFRGLRKSQIV